MKFTFGKFLIALPILVLMVFGIVLYWAWATWVLWNWYAPLAGLPSATFAQVYAYCILFRALTGHRTIYAKNEESKKEDTIYLFASPLIGLAFGWIMLQILK
jgi:hypothetical protein